MLPDAPGDRYTASRTRCGVLKVLNTIIIKRAAAELQMQLALLDFIQMQQDLKGGEVLPTTKPVDLSEQLVIGQAFQCRFSHGEPPRVVNRVQLPEQIDSSNSGEDHHSLVLYHGGFAEPVANVRETNAVEAARNDALSIRMECARANAE